VQTQSQEKYQEVVEVAETLYRQNPDWVTFFREVLGVEGTVRKAFPTFDELTAFEQSPQFDKIQKLLVRLREKRSSVDVETEPTRVITVRLPKSMHEYLRTEAHDLRTSMNKLCISKLLQVIGEDMIPNERTGASGETTTTTAPRLSQGTAPATASTTGFNRTQPTHATPGAVAGSTYGGGGYQPQTPPPFKPVQARI
jgi:predicted HicB family RNase H-like nuclease